MTALAKCPACRFGRHEDHVKDWKPAPAGMFGGAQCPCEGGCTSEAEYAPLGWTPPTITLDALKAYADERGRDWTSPSLQVEFMLKQQGLDKLRITPVETTYHVPGMPSRTTYDEVEPGDVPAFGDIITDKHGRLYKVNAYEVNDNGRTIIEARQFDEP